jgi:predicted CXXCH cytochrome family protein
MRNVKQYKVVHGPVNVNACDACHKLVDPAQHKYTDVRDKTETCTFCHKLEMPAKVKVVHKPVARGSASSVMIRMAGRPRRSCAGRIDERHVRFVSQGDAGEQVAHPRASGGGGVQLMPPGPRIGATQAAGGDWQGPVLHLPQRDEERRWPQVKFKHKAVEQDCTNCHDAHGSNYRCRLSSRRCSCARAAIEHDKIKQAAMDAKVKQRGG